MSAIDCLKAVVDSRYDRLNKAVAIRFRHIRPKLKQRAGNPFICNGMLYDGGRCSPNQLGWRFRQNCLGPHGLCNVVEEDTIAAVLMGAYDVEIEVTWHDAASAEYWYKYEKRWD